MVFIKLLMIIACSILWRMGGSRHYDTLYRDIGCSLCFMVILGYEYWYALPLFFWGCRSYFGWINNFIDGIEKDREYWWNFFAENSVIQLTILFLYFDLKHAIIAVLGALIVSLVKVWIDKQKWNRTDIPSELWHGGGNALCLFINQLI